MKDDRDVCEVDMAAALGVPRKVLRELRGQVLEDGDWYVGSNRTIVYRWECLEKLKNFVQASGGGGQELGLKVDGCDDASGGGEGIVGDSGASELVEVVKVVEAERMERHGHVVRVHRVWPDRLKMVEGWHDGKRVRVDVRDARLMRPGMFLGPCDRVSKGVFIYRGQCPVRGKERRFFRPVLVD